MLTQVEVRTDQGLLLKLPLQDISEGYAVAEIEGLDPVKATLVTSNFAMVDGAQYQSSRREMRNITIKLALEPDYAISSVQQLRSRLYTFFMPKSRVQLRFYISDGLTVDIEGRVESFETEMFTREPMVNISVLCFNPDFQAIAALTVPGLSTPSTGTEFVIDYQGTVETGIHFRFSPNRAVNRFSIINRDEDYTVQKLEFVAPLTTGQEIVLSTQDGAKGVWRTSTEESLLYGIAPYSKWINLFPGRNNLKVEADGAGIPFVITYTNKYGGL